MGMTVSLDRMIHVKAVHPQLGKEVGLEGCCAEGGKGEDINPIDLLAWSVASCLLIVMAKAAEHKDIDLTGTWADAAYQMRDYKIASISVSIHSPYLPAEGEQKFLERESHRCPVYLALKDGVAVNVAFDWGTTAAPAATQCMKSSCQCA
jgi:uncharacterized OsmC-like protein